MDLLSLASSVLKGNQIATNLSSILKRTKSQTDLESEIDRSRRILELLSREVPKSPDKFTPEIRNQIYKIVPRLGDELEKAMSCLRTEDSKSLFQIVRVKDRWGQIENNLAKLNSSLEILIILNVLESLAKYMPRLSALNDPAQRPGSPSDQSAPSTPEVTESPVNEVLAEYLGKLRRRQRDLWKRISFKPGAYILMNIEHDLTQSIGSSSREYRNIHVKTIEVPSGSHATLINWLASYKFGDNEPSVSSSGTASEHITNSGIHQNSPPRKLRKPPGLHLLASEQSLGGASNSTLPFSCTSFVSLMDSFKLPSEFVVALLTGTPTFKLFKDTTPRGNVWQFVMRMPLSSSNDWTLGLSWDSDTLITRALLQGMQIKDLDLFKSTIVDYKDLSSHPLLLPLLLCELLTESDSNEIRYHARELYKVEIRTNWLRIDQLGFVHDGKSAISHEDEFESLTRTLNSITSRLAFLESRVNSTIGLVRTITRYLQEMKELNNDLSKSDDSVRQRWDFICIRLEQGLENLRTEHEALLIDIACNQKISQGQLQIVYNLIAQKDNRHSLRIATTSKNIAANTKEDSFAMRTIAFMTIAFLPATAVSSIFSMSMFNWQAGLDASIVSSRFWIYWVVAIPLTAVVMLVWHFWTDHHEKKERNKDNDNDSSSDDGSFTIRSPAPASQSRYMNKFFPAKKRRLSNIEIGKDNEKRAESAHQEFNTHPRGGVKDEALHSLPRLNTFFQGPMR